GSGVAEGLLLALGLALFADDALALVANALALVGLRRAEATDVGGDRAEQRLVGRAQVQLAVLVDLGLDAVGQRIADRVREAEREVDAAALDGRAVTDADDLERSLEALGAADDHVVGHRASHAVQ